MKVVAYILTFFCSLLLVACASKSDLDAAQNKVAELQGQVSQLQAENAKLKAELTRKPALPVTMGVRPALMGPGYVAVFNTTIKAPVTVLATITSVQTGAIKKFELHLSPESATELGHMEGATLDNGDTVTLENKKYAAATFTVSVQ